MKPRVRTLGCGIILLACGALLGPVGAAQAQEGAPVVPAKVRFCPDLSDFYPQAALRAGVEGTATFRFRVEPTGAASGTVLVQGSGSDALDAAAQTYVRRCRFVPDLDPAMAFSLAVTFRAPD